MEAQSQGECVPELELTKNLLQIRSSEVAQRADGHSSGTDGGGANTPRYFPLCVPTGGLHHVTFPPSMGDLRTERVPRKGLRTGNGWFDPEKHNQAGPHNLLPLPHPLSPVLA